MSIFCSIWEFLDKHLFPLIELKAQSVRIFWFGVLNTLTQGLVSHNLYSEIMVDEIQYLGAAKTQTNQKKHSPLGKCLRVAYNHLAPTLPT